PAARSATGPLLPPRQDDGARLAREHLDKEDAQRLSPSDDHVPLTETRDLVRRREEQLPTPDFDRETEHRRLRLEHPVRTHRNRAGLAFGESHHRFGQLDLRGDSDSFQAGSAPRQQERGKKGKHEQSGHIWAYGSFHATSGLERAARYASSVTA